MRHKKMAFAVVLGLLAVVVGNLEAAGGSTLKAAQETAKKQGKTLIILKTSCTKKAGTDSEIQVQVNNGNNGNTDWVSLDNSGNDRERCDEDYYYVTFPHDAGSVVRLRTNSRGAGPSWKLEKVSIYPANPTKEPRETIWNIWLGDNKHRGTWCAYEGAVAAGC
jgi:hypothetical protein